jgi:hypothetical protein
MEFKEEQESGKNILEAVKDLESKRDEFRTKYKKFRRAVTKTKI